MKCLSLLLLLGSSLAAQSVYYVAANGSDSAGNGSITQPWATITNAARQIPDNGSVIVVRSGTYNGRVYVSRQFQNPVIIRSEQPLQAKLRNADDVALLVYGGSGIEFAGFDIARSNPQTAAPLAVHIAASDNIVLRSNFIHESYNNDLVKLNESCRNILILGNIFRNQQGAAGQHIDVNGCSDVLIRENIFFNDASAAGLSTSVTSATNGFIIIKNSGSVPESRRTRVVNNVFLNYQSSIGSAFVGIGEDGMPFHEAQEITVENNLLLGNSSLAARSPFSVKGARAILFRNNTIVGAMPAKSFAVRFVREGQNPINEDITLRNNVWSNPTGTMTKLFEGLPADSANLTLLNNLYWNGSQPVPSGADVLNYSNDAQAVVADPHLPLQAGLVLPNWQGTRFVSGTTTIRAEFERLVNTYGKPAAGSATSGRSVAAETPNVDILDAPRVSAPDLGAVEAGATAPAAHLVLLQSSVMGGVVLPANQLLLRLPQSGDSVVALSSSNPAVAAVPVSIPLAAGETSAGFIIKTSSVSSPTPVTIRAVSGANTVSATLLVVPQGLVSVNPRTFAPVAGDSNHLLMMEGPASTPLTVPMSSSRPDIVSFPAPATVAAGAAYGTFSIRCQAVTQATPVTITASWNGKSVSSTITVQPGGTAPKSTVAIASIQPDTSSLSASSTTNVKVTLSSPAPSGGAVIQMSATPSQAITIPVSVTVPSGASAVSFPLTSTAVQTATSVTVTATASSTSSRSATVQISPASSASTSTGAYPASVYTQSTVASGSQVNATVVMNTTASSAITVALQTSRPDLVKLPASIQVPAGASRFILPVTFGSVSANAAVTVSLTASGRTLNVSFTITPPAVTYHAAAASSIKGGGSLANNLVMISAPAAAGATVTLVSSNPSALSVPASVTVPSGSNRVAYAISTTRVGAPVTVTIRATSGGVTKTATVTVNP